MSAISNSSSSFSTRSGRVFGSADSLEAYLSPVARFLLSLIFVLSGIGKIVQFSTMVGFAQAKGLPAPQAAIAVAALVEVVGGVALLTGFKARWAALVLGLFLIPTTLIFHNFWAVTDAMQHQDQFIHFMKNVAILGGLLMVVAHGAGGLSVDAAMRRRDTSHPGA